MTGSIRRGGTISYSIPQFYKMILFTIPDNVESIEFCAFSGCDKGTLLHNEIFSMVCLKKWSADSISSDFLY